MGSSQKPSNIFDPKQIMEPFLQKYSAEELNVLAKIPRLYRNKRTYRYTQDIININPGKVSTANMNHLIKHQLSEGTIGLSEEEMLKKGDKILTREERKLYDAILKTQWTLKHITFDYDVIKEKGNILKSLQQRMRENNFLDNSHAHQETGNDDNVFFTLGSPKHKGAGFLQGQGGYVISVDVNHYFEGGKLKETLSGLQLSDHWFQYLNEGGFSQTYGNTRRDIKFFNDTGESLTLKGHKIYSYYLHDGTILTRTASLGQETVTGAEVFPFLAYYLILELRYIGGQYRQHLFDNLEQREVIEASIDSFYHSSNFEATIPSQLNLNCPHITVAPQDTNPANTVSNSRLMHEAIAERQIDKIKALLEVGVSVDILDDKGVTPLIKALSTDRDDIACFLIDSGANLKLTTKNEGQSYSALAVSILAGKIDIVEKILSVKIVLDDRDSTIFRQIDINRDLTALSAGISRGYLSYFLRVGLNVEKFSPYVMFLLTEGLVSEKMAIHSINVLLQQGYKFHYGKNKRSDHNLSLTLLNAVHQQKLTLVEHLIKWGSNLNVTPLYSDHPWCDTTPLMLAAMSGNMEIVEMLVKSGADINKHDKSGRTALMLAEEMKYRDIIKFLKHQPHEPKNPAVSLPKTEIAKALIYRKSSKSGKIHFLVGQKRSEKNYELLSLDSSKQVWKAKSLEELAIKAVSSGTLIDLLPHIAHGNVKRKIFDRYEFRKSNVDLVIETHEYLVDDIRKLKPYPSDEYGDVRWISNRDITNRRYLISNYDYPMMESLIKNHPFHDHAYLHRLFELNAQLFVAIQKNSCNAVEKLLAAGADTNSLNGKYLTPLAIACDTPNPNLMLIRKLIQNGALLNHACVYEAIACDAPNPNLTLFQPLIQNGVLLSHARAYEMRELVPLQLAMLQKSKALVSLLCENGANPNQKLSTCTTRNQKLGTCTTPLLTACELEDLQLIEELISCGADFTTDENKGILARLCAVPCTDDLFDYLLVHADINGLSAQLQCTPLMVCAKLGDVNRIKKLLAKGADPFIRHPRTFKSASDLALEERNWEIAGILRENNDVSQKDIGMLNDFETYYSITKQNDVVAREELLRDEFCLVSLETDEFTHTKSFLYQLAEEVAPESFNLSYEIAITTHSDSLIQTLPVFNNPVIAIHKDFLTGLCQNGQYSIEALKFALTSELESIKNHPENLFIHPKASEQYAMDQIAVKKCQSVPAALAYLRASAGYKKEDCANFKLPDAVFASFSDNALKAGYADRIEMLEMYLEKNSEVPRKGKQSRWLGSHVINEINSVKDKTFFSDRFPHSSSKVRKINYLTSCLPELKIEVIPYELTSQPSTRVKEFCTLVKSININLNNKEEYEAANQLIQQAFDLHISTFERIYDAVCQEYIGKNIHIMQKLPNAFNKYIASYLFINKEGAEELFYVKKNSSYEKIKISDMSKFKNSLKEIIGIDVAKYLIHLTDSQIKKLIATKGGCIQHDYIPLGPFNQLALAIDRFRNAEKMETAKRSATEAQKIYSKLRSHFNNYDYKLMVRGSDHLAQYLYAQDAKNKHLPTDYDRYFGSNIGSKIDWPTFQRKNCHVLPWSDHLKFLDEAYEEDFDLIIKMLEMLSVNKDPNIWERLPDKKLLELVTDKPDPIKKEITGLPAELAEYTDNGDHTERQKSKTKIFKILVNRSLLQVNIFNKIPNFEGAFKEFYDTNINHLRLFSDWESDAILNTDNKAAHILLDKFSAIAQSGTEEEKQIVKSFFLNRADRRDLSHLQKWRDFPPVLPYQTSYIKFIMEQEYHGKTFQLFSLSEILIFYRSSDVSFHHEVPVRAWLKIVQEELPFTDLSIETLVAALPLLDNLCCDKSVIEKIFQQYMDTFDQLPVLSQEVATLVRLVLVFFNSSSSLKNSLLDKLNWNQLSEKNFDCRLATEDMIFLYRIHDVTLKFPSEEQQKLLGDLLLAKIKNILFVNDKITLLEQLMFTENGYFNSPLADCVFRNEVIALWTEVTLIKYGPDDVSYAYYHTMKEVIDRINTEASPRDKCCLFQQLAKSIESQSGLRTYMREIISPTETKYGIQEKNAVVITFGNELKLTS